MFLKNIARTMKGQHIADLIVFEAPAFFAGPLHGIHRFHLLLGAAQQTCQPEMTSNRMGKIVDFRPHWRNRQTAFIVSGGSNVIFRRRLKQQSMVRDFLHRPHLLELPERRHRIAPRKMTHRLPVARILLPSNLLQLKNRDLGKLLEAPECVPRFHRGVLLGIPHQ